MNELTDLIHEYRNDRDENQCYQTEQNDINDNDSEPIGDSVTITPIQKRWKQHHKKRRKSKCKNHM